MKNMQPNSLKNLKAWPKGMSGNPGGKPRVPEELRGINSFSQLEITKLISKYGRMTGKEILACQQTEDGKPNPDLTVMELAIISIFEKSIENGDCQKLSFLLDRCVGKLDSPLENEEADDARAQLQKLSFQELVLFVRENLPEGSGL